MHGGLSSAFLPSSFINDAQRLVICLFNSLTLFYCSYFMTHGELCSKRSSSALRIYGNITSVMPEKVPFVLFVFCLWTWSNITFLLIMFLSVFNFLRKLLTQLCCMLKKQLTHSASPLYHFIAAHIPLYSPGIFIWTSAVTPVYHSDSDLRCD